MGEGPRTRRIFIREGQTLPSIESLFGWHSQYERMTRSYERLKNDESLDALITLFLHCFSLCDWLTQSKALTKAFIHAEINNDISMKLCRDICNRSKHLALDRSSSIDKNLSIVRFYRGRERSPGHMVLAGDHQKDLHDVASCCVEFWERVLRARKLL
jgi:hypothetical protein